MLGDIIDVTLRSAIGIAVLVVLTRFFGLRSFSKMSGFDFAITVAFGSILAGMVTTLSTPIWVFLAAFVALFLIQAILAIARVAWDPVEKAIDNTPRLIMKDGEVLEQQLRKARMTKSDLYAKLREANAFDCTTVHSVVVESTGDVSVIHRPSPEGDVTKELLSGVKNGS